MTGWMTAGLAGWLLVTGIDGSWAIPSVYTPESEERLRLVHADSLVSISRDGEEIAELIGHVQLVQGTAYLRCQNARLWQNENRAILSGDVTIHDGKRTLWSDRVFYEGKSRTEEAVGRVILQSDQRRITARRLTYLQEQQQAKAHGDVVISDLVEMATLEGDSAFYDRSRDYGFVEGRPRLVKKDSVSEEQMIVQGLKIEAWGEDQRVVVTDSVRIEKGDLNASCRLAEYRTEEDVLILQEMPFVWHRDQHMRGDRIDILLDELDFKGSVIQGNAEIISKDSTYEDILKGRQITIEASRDTIRKVVIEGQASSVYHVFDEEQEERQEQGINTVTGDRLILTFDGDRLDRVNVESTPAQSTGTYRPKRENQKGTATEREL